MSALYLSVRFDEHVHAGCLAWVDFFPVTNMQVNNHVPAHAQPRGLAHPLHWRGPLGPAFERFGAVKASPRAMYTLLQANQQVLLFPGGAREVWPCRGEGPLIPWLWRPCSRVLVCVFRTTCGVVHLSTRNTGGQAP